MSLLSTGSYLCRQEQTEECVDVFHYSQHPTKTVNLFAFSAMSGSSSFSVDSAFSNETLLEDRKPSTRYDLTAVVH